MGIADSPLKENNMANAKVARVPQDLLLDGAQMVLAALVAGTVGFLKRNNIPVKDWVSYIGERFGGAWSDLYGEDVDQVMQHLLALQVLPLGVEVISSELAPEKATVSVTPFPSPTLLAKFGTTPLQLLRGFGVTQKELSSIYGMHESAAEAIGLRLTYELKGGKQLLNLERVAHNGNPKERRRGRKNSGQNGAQ